MATCAPNDNRRLVVRGGPPCCLRQVRSTLLQYITLALLCIVGSMEAHAQTTAPDQGVVIDDALWNADSHFHWYANTIIASSAASPLTITADASSELISGTQVHLTENFHAGGFGANGHFRAWIDDAQGTAADLVQITPDPATHVIDNVMHVEKWEKLELGLKPPQDFVDAIDNFFANFYTNGEEQPATPSMVDLQHDLNPYADDSLLLIMRLSSPSGAQKMKWGFYMREAMWPSAADSAMLVVDAVGPLTPYPFRFRIAPDEVGTWNFSITISAPHTTNANGILYERTFGNYSFVCDPPLPDNHGPLQVNQTNHRNLQFKDSTAFFGLGTNMAGPYGATPGLGEYLFGQRDFKTMAKTMNELHSVGGNTLRMWLLRNVFAPEWVNAGVYDAYKAVPPPNCGPTLTYTGNCQTQCWAFDRMLDTARANEIYIQLTLPLGPGAAYETFIWGADPYVIRFLENNRDTAGLFDVKNYFFTDGNPSNTNDGVFYYWKRKYKYIMSRWGYSVNISSIEPFNEMDGLLTYGVNRDIRTPAAAPDTYYGICNNNHLYWPEDPDLPATISNWFSSISHFVRDPVDLSNPAYSPLGESDKLFLASFTDGGGPDDEAHYLPFTNPDIDLIDVHKYYYEGNKRLSDNFIDSQAYRDSFPSNGQKKPFQNGEVGTWGYVDHDNITATADYPTFKVFSNYDVSFHNEIWASTFFGNFAAGSSWFWERVFWWPNALPVPPYDNNNTNHELHSNVNGTSNFLLVNSAGMLISDTVVNRAIYHNFKPLHTLLNNPNWQGVEFFNGNYTPHHIYNDTTNLECYYLKSANGQLAVGWVHNLNAYWENQYYLLADSSENFLGCAEPIAQQLIIPDLQAGLDYYVSFFPTRMNTTVHPTGYLDDTGTGDVLLDLSTAPLGGILNNYLDTLHADYAFIIDLYPVPKSLTPSFVTETKTEVWEFGMYPNPANNEVNLLLPDDDRSKDVVIYDLSGKQIRSMRSLSNTLLNISTSEFAKGPYCVRVSDQYATRMKILIIQ